MYTHYTTLLCICIAYIATVVSWPIDHHFLEQTARSIPFLGERLIRLIPIAIPTSFPSLQLRRGFHIITPSRQVLTGPYPALRRLSQVRGKLGVRKRTQSEEFDDFDVFPQQSLFTKIIYK